jgi:hypothetical protein
MRYGDGPGNIARHANVARDLSRVLHKVARQRWREEGTGWIAEAKKRFWCVIDGYGDTKGDGWDLMSGDAAEFGREMEDLQARGDPKPVKPAAAPAVVSSEESDGGDDDFAAWS